MRLPYSFVPASHLPHLLVFRRPCSRQELDLIIPCSPLLLLVFLSGDLGWRAPAGVAGSNMAGHIVLTGE